MFSRETKLKKIHFLTTLINSMSIYKTFLNIYWTADKSIGGRKQSGFEKF